MTVGGTPMKTFNDAMALIVFALSVVCLATSSYNSISYSLLDYALAWMGVVCFSAYFMRDTLKRYGGKTIELTTRFRKNRDQSPV